MKVSYFLFFISKLSPFKCRGCRLWYSSPVLLAVRLLMSTHTEPTQSEAPIDLVQIHHPKGHGHGQEQEHRHRHEMDVIWTFKIYKSDIRFRKKKLQPDNVQYGYQTEYLAMPTSPVRHYWTKPFYYTCSKKICSYSTVHTFTVHSCIYGIWPSMMLWILCVYNTFSYKKTKNVHRFWLCFRRENASCNG